MAHQALRRPRGRIGAGAYRVTTRTACYTGFHKNQLRAAKFRDGHRHHHGVDERIGRVHGRRLALSLSDCDGSVRSIVLRVHLGSDGEDLFVHVHVEKTKSTSCSGNLLSIVVVLTFLTSSSRCKLLKEDLRILQGSIYRKTSDRSRAPVTSRVPHTSRGGGMLGVNSVSRIVKV